MKSLLKRLSLLIHSIRFRLALMFVVILGMVILLFSGFVYTRQKSDLRAAAVTRLNAKVQRLAAVLRYSESDFFEHTPLRIPSDPNNQDALLQESDVLAFLNTDEEVIQSWGPLEAKYIPTLAGEALAAENGDRKLTTRLFSARLQTAEERENYVFMLAPITFERRFAGYYLIGSPVDPDRQLPRLLVSLGIGIFLTLALALVGGFWLADRAMRPVQQITDTARTIGETDLSRRLNLNRRDELGELADTFDDMLARLQAAFERQRQFTADASHELRTPLTIVDLETSRALAAHRPAQEYERALGVIKSENQFMIRLVNNLLTLARMDAGQVILQKEVVDLSDVALEVVERLAPIALKEQVRLSTGELPELPVLGDRQYLAQMLSNLVENGIKYSSGENRSVAVETGTRDGKTGREAWARVTDNGQGIPPDHLPHLFDRFYQVDKARTQQDRDEEPANGQASGSGLGLSIVQWIARAHGGEVQVTSEVGRGTTFEVRLPLEGNGSTG